MAKRRLTKELNKEDQVEFVGMLAPTAPGMDSVPGSTTSYLSCLTMLITSDYPVTVNEF